MPVKLISGTNPSHGYNVPATDKDKALLIRANTHPPGIRGLLRIPTDPLYITVILCINFFTYACVVYDFTQEVCRTEHTKKTMPMEEGSCRNFIFCFDFIFLIDVLLSICHRKAKMTPERSIAVIILDIISLMPYEMVFVVLRGTHMRIYFGLRLRYIIRLYRYIPEARKPNRFKLSAAYVMWIYVIFMCGFCILASCIRLGIHCLKANKGTSIIQCEDITMVDFLYTYAILNSQISYSGMLFVDDTYADISHLDSIVQIFMQCVYFFIIPKIICILLQNNQHRYTFCMTGNYVLKGLGENRKSLRHLFQINTTASHLRTYMAAYWKHSIIENMRTSYVSNYKAATIPSVIYSEMTLDLNWNMFKHSILFKNESVAFLRQLSKLTVFNFGAKNDIIFSEGKYRSHMIYIISGVVCMVNESSGRSPLMTFSAGTVFGELSLFMNVLSSTTVFCSTYCEYIVLSRSYFNEIRKVYPEIYNKLRAKCLKRVDYARNYDFIAREMYENGDIKLPKCKVSLRYIKSILRTYMRAPPLPLKQSIFIPSNMAPEASFPGTIFNATYIPLYVEANKIESSFMTHFAVTGINFKLNENSTLNQMWRFGISTLTLIDCVFFPLGAAQDTELYVNVYDYFVVAVNIFNILDFLSFNFVTHTHRDRVIADSESILVYKMQKIGFWLDLIACIPVEKVLNLMQTPLNPYAYRLLGFNRLIKLYKVFRSINNHLTFSSIILIILPIIKSIYAVILMLQFGYLSFHRFGYFDLCNIDIDSKDMSFMMKIYIVYQFFFSMSEVGMQINRTVNLIPMILLQVVGSCVFTSILCLNAASFSLIYKKVINYENLIDDIKRILVLFKFPYGPRRKMARFMKLLYDVKKPVDDDIYHKMMGKALYREHCIKLHYDFISRLKLFAGMSNTVLNNICEVAEVILIPKGEFVVNAGGIVKHVFFIMDGRCEYIVRDGMDVQQPLTTGDAIVLFEAILNSNALSNVMAVTDCRLLSISANDLRHKLVKFPDEMQIIMKALTDVITRKQLGQFQIFEPRVTAMAEERESCRYFNGRILQFNRAFGMYHFASICFMRQSITPFGRFWFWWEIAHIAVAFLYSFLGSIPSTVSCNGSDGWFWFFRLLDVFCLVDIYLRHHVIYFDKHKIEIDHPWKCALHYWKTNFFVDLIASIPFELIILPGIKSIQVTYLVMMRINRILRLLRYRGINSFLKFQYLKTFKVEALLVYICFSLVFYNYMGIWLSRGQVIYLENCRPVYDGAPLTVTQYIGNLHKAFKQFCNIGIHERFENVSQLWLYVLMNIFGQIALLTLTCVIIGMSLFRIMYLMTFQIKMQRLILFLNQRKIDKSLRNEIIKHYEFLWKLKEGKVMKEALQNFNRILTEDVIYSYYAPKFQKTVLFMDYPKVLLRDLFTSPSTHRDLFLITGVIIRVNTVQDKIYIIFNGTVQVLGPDYSYLRDLGVGSIFGCLDDVPFHRTTLTYVAKTHCEVMSIQSTRFHDLLSKYPRYYKHYMNMLRKSNFDYVPASSFQDDFNDDLSTIKTASTVEMKETEERNRAKWLKKKGGQIAKSFPVLKDRENVKVALVLYLLIAFQFECMLITYLHTYFSIVVFIAYGIDLIFWIKMYIDFSTEYENAYGIIIRDRRLIAIRYSSRFFGVFFHIVAGFPFEIVVLAVPINWFNPIQLWAYLRCNRLLKIILVFKYVHSVRNRLNINVRLIKSIEALLVLYTTQQFSTIFLSYYFDDVEYMSAILFHSYFISKKIYTPFRNDIPEFTNTITYNLIYLSVLLSSQLIQVLVIGNLVATFQMLSYNRLRYETFLNEQESVMSLMSVSPPLFNRVKNYCRNLLNHGLNVQFPGFLIDAPYYLREGILDAMFGFHLRSHPVFKMCHTDFNRQVAASFKTSYFFEGDFIVFEGDIDTKMYFIHVGEVEGLIEDNLYYEVADSKYFAGDYFGFHQLIYTNVGHTKTYKVVSKMAMVLSLKRKNIMKLLDFFPATKYFFSSLDIPNDDLDIAPIEYRDYHKYTKEIHE